MAHDIDQIMERASQALAKTDYLACERLCLEALRAAEQARDYDRIARILMPLQEARRQRRQNAADAGVVLLGEPRQTPQQILDEHAGGCLMLLDPPYAPDDVDAVRRLALEQECHVEVLRFDHDALLAAFLWRLELQGDAYLASIHPDAPPREQVRRLIDVLDKVGDHEIAHQRLAQAAREAARSS